MNEVLTPILARVTRGTELLPEEIEAALAEILEGRVADIQAAGFIVALRTKGESVEELAALVKTMHRYAEHVDVAAGAIDTCGTGGDRSGTINVSTMAAIIAAGAGARVVKHGNRAQSSKCGSADVLEALGVAIEFFEVASSGEPHLLSRTFTNADGRTDQPLFSGMPIPIATYELRFAVSDYFAREGAPMSDPPFLGVVPIRFAVAEPEGKYHVPLSLTPWAYSTYRGS